MCEGSLQTAMPWLRSVYKAPGSGTASGGRKSAALGSFEGLACDVREALTHRELRRIGANRRRGHDLMEVRCGRLLVGPLVLQRSLGCGFVSYPRRGY